jgi:hypothetical protein
LVSSFAVQHGSLTLMEIDIKPRERRAGSSDDGRQSSDPTVIDSGNLIRRASIDRKSHFLNTVSRERAQAPRRKMNRPQLSCKAATTMTEAR